MGPEDLELINEGLKTRNRGQSEVNHDDVVNYLLLYSPVPHEIGVNEDHKHQQSDDSNTVKTETYGDSFEAIAQNLYSLPTALDEVSLEDVNITLEQMLKTLPSDDEWSDDDNDNVTSPLNYTALSGNPNKGKSDPLPNTNLLHINETTSSSWSESEVPHLHHGSSAKSLSATASAEDILRRRITPDRFRDIISKSDKRYDAEGLIKELADETGHIPLERIASYRKRFETLTSPKLNQNLKQFQK